MASDLSVRGLFYGAPGKVVNPDTLSFGGVTIV